MMEIIIQTLCLTFIIVLIIYWIMPTKKLKTVNEALKSLLQVLPITQTIKALSRPSNTSEEK